MLNETDREAALQIVMGAKDPDDFPAVNDRLCREFPSITTEDLIALWREAAERQLAEADALEAYGAQRQAR